MNTKLFVVSHRKLKQEFYPDRTIIYVGKNSNKLKEENDYTDNTGLNISERNYTYCECSAMYWIYKNVKCDIVGIEHYRRVFSGLNFKFLSKKKAEKILNKYDFIVMVNFIMRFSVKNQFIKSHTLEMYNAMEDAVKKIYPEYMDAFNKSMNRHFNSWCNMMITSKENYDKYCKFLFDILFEIEKNITIPKDKYQSRIMGFIAERLLNVYLIKNNNLKVKYKLIRFTKNYLK